VWESGLVPAGGAVPPSRQSLRAVRRRADMPARAVCFDMDGVVVDSERHWVPLENERILPAAVPGADVTAGDITGMNVRDLYAHLSAEYGTALDEGEFLALYDDAAEELYTERAALLDGFEELVGSLREAEVAVALVSSSPRRWIRLVLERFGLADRLDAVVSADDVDSGKPAPDVYERAADRLGVAPGRCVAVEDSTHGLAAALAAGMEGVGYRTAVNAGQDLSAADTVAEGPVALGRVLRERCD